MSQTFTIQTERLFLREMNDGDYDALYAVLADSDIMRHYSYTFDEKRVRNWIFRNIERYRILGFGLWAVCLKDTGEMIGDCGLSMQVINRVIRPEIGYHLRHDMQRKGYAHEAAEAVCEWAFTHTTFGEIYSYMTADNEPSWRCAMSWGCRQVDEYTDPDDGPLKVFRITKEEWEEKRRRDIRIALVTPDNFRETSLDEFDRYQEVSFVYRPCESGLTLKYNPFCETWSPARRREKASEIMSGDYVTYCAYDTERGGRVVGEIMLVPTLDKGRLIIDSFHVSREYRRQGIGRALFAKAAETARGMGARALYMSACSARETIDFYTAMGCVPSPDPIPAYAEDEPCDIQMECCL